MRILRASAYRTMPWKNGGGTTTEIAVHPEGAGLYTFEWRVSMARVETDGPFSAFSGIDRTLAVLEGQGIVLDIKGEKPVTLDRASKPHSFPADVQTSASLVAGPITDLNVMTRRGEWSHIVEKLSAGGPLDVNVRSNATLVLVAQGSVGILWAGEQASLSPLDCAMLDGRGETLDIEPRGDIQLFVIHLNRAA
ncbi:MAG: HutD family protein [Rhizobiaceae bacterium]|nr:HutD family protein [Rhizobiaceae bacterium]